MRTGGIRKSGSRRRLLSGLMAALIIFSMECANVYADGGIPGQTQLVGIGITTKLNLPVKETGEEVSSDNTTSSESEGISEESTISAEAEGTSEESTVSAETEENSGENTTPTETENATGESGSTEPQSEAVQETENSQSGNVSDALPKISPVQTGDRTEIRMYVIVGIVALAVMLESIVMRKKVRK